MRLNRCLIWFNLFIVLGCGKPGSNDNPSDNNPQSSDATGQVVTDGRLEPEQTCLNSETRESCLIGIEIFNQVNLRRQVEGIPYLDWQRDVALVAENWSHQQLKQGRISHDGFPEQRNRTHQRLFPNQVTPKMIAENVGLIGFQADAGTIATMFVDMWMKSDGHRANMMSRENSGIGVGVTRSQQRTVATQIFTIQ